MICLFVLTQLTNVTDEQTDRQTPHDDIGRACFASRGNDANLFSRMSNQENDPNFLKNLVHFTAHQKLDKYKAKVYALVQRSKPIFRRGKSAI